MDKNEYKNDYLKFLELSEAERYDLLMGCKLYWWQKLEIKFVNKWWTRMRRRFPDIRAIDLWESIYKSRF